MRSGRRHGRNVAGLDGEFGFDSSFVANLARGHYSVSFYAYDTPTRAHLIHVRRIATITVTEHRTRSGIANLDMAAKLSSSIDRAPQPVG